MWLPQGFGSLPNSLLRLWETPYATLLVFPALPSLVLSVTPARAGIPLWLGSSNTTSRTLITQWVRPAGTGSLLGYYPSQITRTSSGALYQHPILRNHTIYTLHSINIRYNSISGLYGYFKARIHNNFIIHQKHVCSCQEYTSDGIILPVTAGSRHQSGGSHLQRPREVAMPRTTVCGPSRA